MSFENRREFLSKIVGFGKLLVGYSLVSSLSPILKPLEALALESPNVIIHLKKFREYNPEINKEDELDAEEKSFLYFALSCHHQFMIEEKIDEEKFMSVVLDDAAKIGYNRIKLSKLTPRQAVILSSSLVCNRLNYFRTKTDWFEKGIEDNEWAEIRRYKKEAKEKKEKLKSTQDHGKLGIEINDLEERIKKSIRIIETSRKIRDDLAKLPASDPFISAFDKIPSDKIYIEKHEVVCRHYARVNAAVFNYILRKVIPSIRNTGMSLHCTTAIAHLWNQVNTVSKKGDNLEVITTFIDPTWMDTREDKNLDAFDYAHMGVDYAELKKQIKYLDEETNGLMKFVGI